MADRPNAVFTDHLDSLRMLAESPSVYIYVKDRSGHYTFASRGVGLLFGVPPAQIIGRTDADFFDLSQSPDLPLHDQRVLERHESIQETEELWVRNDRQLHVFFSTKVPVLDAQGSVVGLCGVSLDLTEQMRSTSDLVAHNHLLDTVLTHVDAFVFQKDDQGRYLYVNQRVANLYGRPVTDILGHTDLDLLPRHIAEDLMEMDRSVLERNVRDARQETVTGTDGAVRQFWSTKIPLRLPGQAASIIGFASEITELLELQETLRKQKTTDELTGLRNRALFEAKLEEALTLSPQQGMHLAVLMMDIDHFKYINTTYGQTVGDKLLNQVACRMVQCDELQGSLARFSGNKFSATLARLLTPESASEAARRVRAVLAEPISIDGHRFHVTVSVGISVYPTDGTVAPSLITNAEAAMYRAKDKGRDQICFYSHDIGQAIAERAALEHGLHEAIEQECFELYYQPKVTLASEHVNGVEALIRWNREGYGIISPAVFIPLAEQLGLINELGNWIIAQACRQLVAWRNAGLGSVRIAVNLSPYQLRDGTLVPYVQRTMQVHGIAAGQLEMEVTESLMMNNPDEAIAILESLRDLGISLSIDDFGTGFSSMSYLKRLPVDTLKLDKTFINQIATDAREADLCAGIIALSHKLGLKVVAEGVEEAAQLELLRAMQCEIIQGYYYSRPLPVEQAEAYIRRRNQIQ